MKQKMNAKVVQTHAEKDELYEELKQGLKDVRKGQVYLIHRPRK